MKRILVIAFALFAVVVWVSVDLIMDIYHDGLKGMKEAQRLATQATGWKVSDISRFHGQKLYFILTMQDENDQLYYVVIDDQKQISYFPYAELNFDQNEVRHKLSQEYQSWQIKAIRPAYVNQGMCWEVVAQDEEDRYNYLYYAMKDGQFVKRYTLENTLRMG